MNLNSNTIVLTNLQIKISKMARLIQKLTIENEDLRGKLNAPILSSNL